MGTFKCNTSHVLTAAQVGQILGLSPRHVNRMAATGELPTVGKLAGRTGAYIFDLDAIDRVRSDRAAEHREIVDAIRAAAEVSK